MFMTVIMDAADSITKPHSLDTGKDVSHSGKSKHFYRAPVKNAARPGRLTNQLLFLEEQVMKAIWNHQLSRQLHFLLNLTGLPALYTIIPNPIDLTTIKKRLKNNYYQHAAECVQDFLSIFINCYRFHQPTENIVSNAKTLEAIFFKQLSMMPFPEFEIKQKPGKRKKTADVSENKNPPNEVTPGVKRKAEEPQTIPPLRISAARYFRINKKSSSSQKFTIVMKSISQKKNGEAELTTSPSESQTTSKKAAAVVLPPLVLPPMKEIAQRDKKQLSVNSCVDPPKSRILEAEKPQPPTTISAVKHPQAWLSLKNISVKENYQNPPEQKQNSKAAERPRSTQGETERDRLRREAQEHRRRVADSNAFDLTLQARIMAEFEEAYISSKTTSNGMS